MASGVNASAGKMSGTGRLVRWPSLLALVLFPADTNVGPTARGTDVPAETGVAPPADLAEALLDGDLVFRRGRSMLSRAVIVMDPASTYSHVGIAIADPTGGISIIHASPPDAGGPAGVRRDPLADFVATHQATAVAAYRPHAPVAVRRAAAHEAARLHSLSVPFDADFDLTSADRVYCTELVWRAYTAAGIDITAGRRTTVGLAGWRRVAILPTTLTGSPLLHPVVSTPPASPASGRGAHP